MFVICIYTSYIEGRISTPVKLKKCVSFRLRFARNHSFRISATEGVGILMQRFAFRLDMAGSFASLVTMAIMGLLVFTIAEVLDRRIVFWRDTKGLERVSRKKQRKLSSND